MDTRLGSVIDDHDKVSAEGPLSTGVERRLPGRLLGVTASGPIYLGQRHMTFVPLASIFATVQELATRVDNPKAAVSASIACRVSGNDAYVAWMEMSVCCAVQLTEVTLGGRLKFLRFLLSYISSVGRVEGLESLLATAVNAAWPAMSSQALSSTLSLASVKLRKSKFAAKHPIPVLDVNRRIASVFGAGELPKLDLDEWRVQRDLDVDGAGRYLPEGIGGKINEGLKSPLERELDNLFGGSDDASLEERASGYKPGSDTQGVPGGLPSIGDLPGQRGQSKPASKTPDEIAAGFNANPGSEGLPGGLPSLGNLPGRGGNGQNESLGFENLGRSRESAYDLLASIPGSEYGGISGFLKKHGTSGFKTGIFEGATPGGPFAPPGRLGINGSDGKDPGGESGERYHVHNDEYSKGVLLVIGGLALAATGSAGAIVGAGLIVAGGLILVAEALPDPPKEKPHNGDLYPDPIGGGGGNPTQLPDYDGRGGGDPTTMPDYDGHGGGTPNTIFGKPSVGTSIWDDNFGGPGPTVKPQSFTVTALVGPGLMADIVQIGPTSIRY